MSINIYEVDGRVKNHVAMTGIPLSAAGVQMCNMYTHVLMSLYAYAETLPEPFKAQLNALIRSKETMPMEVIKLVNPEPYEDMPEDGGYDECL